MRFVLTFSAACFVMPVITGASQRFVKSVAVPGTALEVKLATQVGRPFDDAAIARDVRYLWSLGRFEDIRVEASDDPDGTAVVFRATPLQSLRLHAVVIEPATPGLQVDLPEGSPIDAVRAQQIAIGARKRLSERGYEDAHVAYQFEPHGTEVDLKLKVDTGSAVRVRNIEFAGDTGLKPSELRRELQALKATRLLPGIPHVWGGWRLLPSYSRDAADSDAARLQSLYLARGYLDATVSAPEPALEGNTARVIFNVNAGSRYSMRWANEDVTLSPLPANSEPAALCSSLFAARRMAERQGILDFAARINVNIVGDGMAELTASTERGQPYRVGRIEFTGNRHFSDAAVRRNFTLDEGALLDERLLRRSLARLNRTGWFENIDEKNVTILRDERTGMANIRVRLTERKAGKWSLSGPVGPASLAGPLEGSVSTRLPAWGRGLLELSTYTVSISAFAFARPLLPFLSAAPASRLPILALRRPFSPGEGWLSGFVIAPQIGWRGSAIAYATTQLQQRVLPALAGDRGLIPELPVMVNRPAGEAVMMCAPPKPRLNALRTGAGVVLQFAGAMTGF